MYTSNTWSYTPSSKFRLVKDFVTSLLSPPPKETKAKVNNWYSYSETAKYLDDPGRNKKNFLPKLFPLFLTINAHERVVVSLPPPSEKKSINNIPLFWHSFLKIQKGESFVSFPFSPNPSAVKARMNSL